MNAYLIPKIRTAELSLYQIAGSDSPVKEYVFSTPETRDICNAPEIAGFQVTEHLKNAVVKLLKAPPLKGAFGRAPDTKSTVLHFLRGGLNFRIRNALAEAYGYNRHYASFLTSQRYRRGDRWIIKQDQYRKLDFEDRTTIFLGDVVATGSTISNGLRLLLNKCVEARKSISNLVFFTNGCQRATELLEEYDTLLRSAFPHYRNSYLFYIEGKFSLAEERTAYTLGISGTDLQRHPALLAPEFELAQYDVLTHPLERCTCYDMGSRSFACADYAHEVIEYWRELGESGLTLAEAYHERWPEEEYRSFNSLRKAKRKTWRRLPEDFYQRLYRRFQERWTPEMRKEADSRESLPRLCRQRVRTLNKALRG